LDLSFLVLKPFSGYSRQIRDSKILISTSYTYNCSRY